MLLCCLSSHVCPPAGVALHIWRRDSGAKITPACFHAHLIRSRYTPGIASDHPTSPGDRPHLAAARLAGARLLRTHGDARLVALAAGGHEGALTALIARHRHAVLVHCRRMLGDSRAEDAAQQTMLLAYTAIVGGTRVDALRPWLYAIARNVCLDVLRANGSNWDTLDEDLRSGDEPAAAIERSETIAALASALAELPPAQRSALVMRELEGRSHKEIARRLGVSPGAARQLVHRARNAARSAAHGLLPPELVARLAALGAPDPPATAGAALGKAGAAALLSAVIAGSATLSQVGQVHPTDGRPMRNPAVATPRSSPAAHEPRTARQQPRPAVPRAAGGMSTESVAAPAPNTPSPPAVTADHPQTASEIPAGRRTAGVEQSGQHEGEAGATPQARTLGKSEYGSQARGRQSEGSAADPQGGAGDQG